MSGFRGPGQCIQPAPVKGGEAPWHHTTILSGTLLTILTHFALSKLRIAGAANVFLAERGFIFRNGVTFEIGARSFEPGRAILVRMQFRRPLIAAGAAVNEDIGIGGQFGPIKRPPG
jgi:hypothetical protein